MEAKILPPITKYFGVQVLQTAFISNADGNPIVFLFQGYGKAKDGRLITFKNKIKLCFILEI